MKNQTQEPELLPADSQPHFQAPQQAMAIREQRPMDVARQQPTVADMLHMVIEKGLTTENVAAFKELVQLHREEVKLGAEKEFAASFVALQRELPSIQGQRGVPDKQGNIKFVYANFDDIDMVVRPICLRHGFSYSFGEEAIVDGRVTMIMRLQHSGGHFRDIKYSVRIGSGPPGATESQSDVSGHTYAKRGALESGLSLRIVGDRDDARMEGDPTAKVTAQQAEELEHRAKMTNSNIPAFLKVAGAASFSEIPANRYDELDRMLRRKEQGK